MRVLRQTLFVGPILGVGCIADHGSRPREIFPAEATGSTGGESTAALATSGPPTWEGEDAGETFGPGPTPASWFDCEPAWQPAFIGSPCASDADCSYEGGFCLRDEQGFPCGTCSQSCEDICPDRDGAPTTGCVDGDGLEQNGGGLCVSRCDPEVLGGNGCRDGYACDAQDGKGVCVPTLKADGPDTQCQAELLELGAVHIPFAHSPETPSGNSSVKCTIKDPVLLYGPINGVGLRNYYNDKNTPVLVSCETARSLVQSAAIAGMLGAEEIIHLGTYVCRTIAGTSRLSQHGLGQAIDIYGFTMTDGSTVTCIDDWQHGVSNPSNNKAAMLRDFANSIWNMMLWNIILTPDYNAAHDNHFHVDITPGGNTYR